MIQFPIGTLGDILAWFPYANKFAAKSPGLPRHLRAVPA